ncbi:MAG TPA: Hsp70 family protein [Kofleriaceae bacterium]|nr:Hsp70 family protein [Kofleriaceae bacterium]
MAREVILGIDFGTSCTSAGALVGDRVELVQDNGDSVVPSVVYLPERGTIEVGRRAMMRQLTDPSGVVRSVKRVLGLRPDSPLVRRYAGSVAFPVETKGDKVILKLRTGDAAPEQLAAAVITRVRELAEQRFGALIKKAVMTLSAAPPEGYRAALMRAARIAHLDVLEMVPEPIAGALALGIHAESVERRVLVCDFGGGTFDVSAVIQNGMKFTPVSTFADPYLGGDDFDEAIAEGLAGVIARKTGYDMHRDSTRWTELVFRCESAKRQLSTQTEIPLQMRDAYVHQGRTHNMEVSLDRPWIEACWGDLLSRSEAVIDEALRRAGWTPDQVDRAALIGGTSMIPAFRALVGSKVGPDKVMLSAQADVSVAIGATLLTARFSREPRNVPMYTAPY